jgi:hypothetical protein
MIFTLHTFSAIIVIYSCFNRLTMTGPNTIFAVRFSIWILCVAATFALFGPFFTEWRPDTAHAFMILAIALIQVVTRRLWVNGCPDSFQETLK